MDIWAWLHDLCQELESSGQSEAARNIGMLSKHVYDFDTEHIETLVSEIKALAKTLDNPWLEVFAGHWEMYYRLYNNLEGESALDDVVGLFEFSHRDDTVDCPQTICISQHVSSCYANIDGPGWVEERIAVCDETLARIDPQWDCFQCLSAERARALVDSNRPKDALDYLDQQIAILRAAGLKMRDDSIGITRIAILIRLERFEEALLMITESEAAASSTSEWLNVVQPRTLYKIEAITKLKRDADAWKLLMPLEDVIPRYRIIWIRIVFQLLQRTPKRNTWQLGVELQQVLNYLQQVGTYRSLIETAILCAHLALQRKAVWSARRILALARRFQGKLRTDHGVADSLNKLAATILNAANTATLPMPVEELLDQIEQRHPENKHHNPEEEAEWLMSAYAQNPDNGDLLIRTAEALEACTAPDDALSLIWRHVEHHHDEETPVISYLLDTLLKYDRIDEVERLIELSKQRLPRFALWCEAKRFEYDGEWFGVINACEELIALLPGYDKARLLLATALKQVGRYDDAAVCYLYLSEKTYDPTQLLWDHMTCASAAGDWKAVRASAAKLHLMLSSTKGPIEEDWGWVIIRYREDGEDFDYLAHRTGPVTARILENAAPDKPQHVGDRVVYDAKLLIDPPKDEEELEYFIPTHTYEYTLTDGGFGPSWLVDGVHPGDQAFRNLRKQLEQRGARVWVHSSRDYTVIDSHNNHTELPAFFFSVAAPETIPPYELHNVLSSLTRDWEHPVSWLRLAEAAEAPIEPHLELIERYGL